MKRGGSGGMRMVHRSKRGGGKVGQPEEGECGFDWAGLGHTEQMVVGPAGVIGPGWNAG
jgi:hypothetical protein